MSGAQVIVIEADARFLPALEDIKTAYPDRLEIVQGDALHISRQPDARSLPHYFKSAVQYRHPASPAGWKTVKGRMGTTLFVHNLHVSKGSCPAHCRRPGHQQLRAFIGLAGWLTQAPIWFDVDRQVAQAAQCHIKHCACGTTRSLASAGRPSMLSQVTAALSDSDGKCCVPA